MCIASKPWYLYFPWSWPKNPLSQVPMCLCRCTLKSRTFCLWAAEIKVFGKKVDQKPWFGGNLPWLDAKTLTSEDSGINFFAIQPVRPEIKANSQKQVFWPKSRKYQHFEAICTHEECPVYYYWWLKVSRAFQIFFNLHQIHMTAEKQTIAV